MFAALLLCCWTDGLLTSVEKDDEKMDVLAAKVATNLRIGMDKHGVTTVAQWVSDLREKQMLLFAQRLDDMLLSQMTLGWISCEPCFNFPSLGTAESGDSGTQAYVSQQLFNIREATHFYPAQEENNDDDDDDDDLFVKTADIALNLQSFPYLNDASQPPSFGLRKPDVVAYAGDSSSAKGALAITIIGEVKGASSSGDFPDDEVGHILDLAKDLLKNHQVHRFILYCFLTDGQRFQFFQAKRQSDGFSFQQSSVFVVGTMGWQILLGLLRSDVSVLGHNAWSVEGVLNLKYLGKGGACVALRGELDSVSGGDASASGGGGGDAVVVKVFNDDEAMDNEEWALNELARAPAVANVPKCLGVVEVMVNGHASAKRALVLSPLGDVVLPVNKGKPTRGQHLTDLVTIVEQVHARGIIHRDIKPENVFLVDGSIMLGDWDIACRSSIDSDECVRWSGTVPYSDPPTSVHGMHYPTPADDLRSLVRCVYVMMFQEAEFPRKMDYWTDRLASGLWKECMDAADALDYDTLRRIFQYMRG
jgi:hypothetical protein